MITTDPPSVEAEPGKTVVVRVETSRAKGLTGDVRLELVCPSHMAGVAAPSVTLTPGQSTGELRLSFAKGALGPFNMPVTVRATTIDSRGYPVIGEAPLSLALPR
jgi:hypothetical protein